MDKLEIIGVDTFDNCTTNERFKRYAKSPALQINGERLHFRCSCIHPAWPTVAWPNQTTILMKTNNSLITILCVMTLILWSGTVWAMGYQPSALPTPWYSVTGTNGTGGGTTNFSLPPIIAPGGSTALTDLAATGLFSFGTGPEGVAGGAISNTWVSQGDLQVLAGTLGAGGVVSNFTLTVWVRQPSAAINTYRLGLISAGSPPNSSSADGNRPGNKLFFGENSGGGLQFYVNNSDGGDSVSKTIAGPNTWNNNGTLGGLQLGRWYFVAITYDSVSNVCVLYSGNQTNACIQAATLIGYGGVLGGPLDLSAATSICLMNRFSGTRAFPGEMDYFNLYTNVLTLVELMAVQLSQLPPPGINFAAGACVLTWTNGGGLLEATNVSGPWVPNPNTSPYRFSPTDAQKFYRIYNPN
jgi:hypothetical protein